MRADNLKPFYYKVFNIEELQNYFHQTRNSIKVQLSRLCKSKKLIRLKKNCYTFADFHPNPFVMAGTIVQPSYHSLESILSLHGIIPETPIYYTLITSKKTQKYQNQFGIFSYRHLHPDLFFGVEKRKDGAWVAKKEKALLDYLYLNSKKLKSDFACFQAERFDELDSLNWQLMNDWAKKYNMKKLIQIVNLLKNYSLHQSYQNHR